MEKKVLKPLVMIAAVVFLLGAASITVAQDTSKSDETQQNTTSQRRGEMRGMGQFQKGNGVPTTAEGLSEDQIQKLQEERAAFQTATRDLRMELQSKVLALRSELAKKEPDAKTAKSLQKEVSALNAELAQKRIEHILEIKKIAPYAGVGQLGNDSEEIETGRSQKNT